jgi:hypothetical protein
MAKCHEAKMTKLQNDKLVVSLTEREHVKDVEGEDEDVGVAVGQVPEAVEPLVAGSVPQVDRRLVNQKK